MQVLPTGLQLQELKAQMRALAESRDAELEAALAPLKSQLETRTAEAAKLESSLKAAKLAAGRANGQVQVGQPRLLPSCIESRCCTLSQFKCPVGLRQLIFWFSCSMVDALLILCPFPIARLQLGRASG